MAGTQYFTGQQGFQGIGKSGAFGNTPGAAALYSFNDNGKTRYFLPETYAAGNNWSGASANADYLKSLGGQAYTTPTYTETNTGNPWGQNYNTAVQKGGYKGYAFDSLPDLAAIEKNSSFLPGQGSNNSFWADGMPFDVALKIGGAMLGAQGLQSMAGAGTIGSGGGTITASGAAPGGALMSAGSQAAPAMGALDAGAGALTGAATSGSTVPAFGGMAGSAAPSIYSSVPASSSFLGSLGGIGDKITSGLGNMGLKDWLGVGDLAGRLWQSNELNNIADEAANRGDALQQPQRLPYQQLLSDYLTGGQDITEQPYVKSNMDFAMKQAQANMAKKGTTGAGGAERELMDYANQAYNATALPYLQQLSGMAGFGFGPGYSGNLYGQYASQATGAPFAGLNELGRMFGYNQAIDPWQNKANNAQYQMTGRGPGFVD